MTTVLQDELVGNDWPRPLSAEDQAAADRTREYLESMRALYANGGTGEGVAARDAELTARFLEGGRPAYAEPPTGRAGVVNVPTEPESLADREGTRSGSNEMGWNGPPRLPRIPPWLLWLVAAIGANELTR